MLYFKPEYSIDVGAPAYFGLYTIYGVEKKYLHDLEMDFNSAYLTLPNQGWGGSGATDSGLLVSGSYQLLNLPLLH